MANRTTKLELIDYDGKYIYWSYPRGKKVYKSVMHGRSRYNPYIILNGKKEYFNLDTEMFYN